MVLVKYVFAVITLCFLAFCSNAPSAVDCKQYKTGKFLFFVNYDGRRVRFTIDRNNLTQTEQCEEMNAVATYKVNWKDDCRYQLVFMDGKDSLPAELQEQRRRMVIQTTILAGTENYYLFEISNNLNDNVMKDTMWLTR